MRQLIILIIGITPLLFYRCTKSEQRIPVYFGEINYPQDNLPNKEKIGLGKRLFFDVRLSGDNTISCASCHKPGLAFADNRSVSPGVGGKAGFRNAPSLLNVAFQKNFMMDAAVDNLEMQAIVPIQDVNEMGITMSELIDKLRSIEDYREAAKKIYQREFDAYVLTRSLAAYERTLISTNSAFDRYFYHHEASAITPEQKRGWKLFDKKLKCSSCHTPPLFTDQSVRNNGLSSKSTDEGRFRITANTQDIGKFKVPSLRNVELTAPYMHNGAYRSLDEVIRAYAQGGGHPNKDETLNGFELTENEKNDLIAFLKSLTDTTAIR